MRRTRGRIWAPPAATVVLFALVSGCDHADEAVFTDPATDLQWEAEPSDRPLDWLAAHGRCADLVLGGADDWRLPEVSELRGLVRGCPSTESSGSCGVTDACTEASCQDPSCYACEPGQGPTGGCYGHPDLGSPCAYTWAAAVLPGDSDRAWAVGFSGGFVYKPRTQYGYGVRCVR